MCGIVGVYGPGAAFLAELGLQALQHRGQESAGISSSDGEALYTKKGMGLVTDVFSPKEIRELLGQVAIGQTRYSTAGGSKLENAQPFISQSAKGAIAVVHNGNITNAEKLRADLEGKGAIFQSTSDTEIVLHLIARAKSKELFGIVKEALIQLEGAFSLLLLINGTLVAARDPKGYRPLILGTISKPGQDATFVVASETCAFDLVGAQYVSEVGPGEIVVLSKDGPTYSQYASDHANRKCVFEFVYTSRPDSSIFGRSVSEVRKSLGRKLAKIAPVAADCVIPVPDSGVMAALGYAAQSGIPFEPGLTRSHYLGRTFIEPLQVVRDLNVRLKFNPDRASVTGKRVVLVDDSLVRGTTLRQIVAMLRNAHAAEIHVRISCPPTIAPCFYGMDTPTYAELIAATKSVEGIRQHIGADSLAYLDLASLKEAVGDADDHCYSCFDNNHTEEVAHLIQLS